MNDNSTSVKLRKPRYDLNFKRSAVELWQGSGTSAKTVAAELGISDVPADGKCPDGAHKIAVLAGRSGPGGDYHFFRQTGLASIWWTRVG